MISLPILYFGKRCVVACDALCDKAWGIQGRPRRMLSDNEDDYVWIGDADLGTAPGPCETAIISEGECCKPRTEADRLNKWCVRQCERSAVVDDGEALVLPDMVDPKPNIPRRPAEVLNDCKVYLGGVEIGVGRVTWKRGTIR